jgi:hypothetical protein
MTVRFAEEFRRFRSPAFTLVELLVASVVLTTALLGVYALFKQALVVDRRAGEPSRQRAQALAVAEHLAAVVRQAVNISDGVAISAGPLADGGYEFTCMTVAGEGGPAGSARLMRYLWRHEEDGEATPRADAGNGVLSVRTMMHSGTTNISREFARGAVDMDVAWERIAPVVLARGLNLFEVRFRSLAGQGQQWQDRFEGNVGDLIVGLRVGVGQSVVEKQIVPGVNIQLGPKEES